MELHAGDLFKHYKGGLYQIVTKAVHTETEESMVVYQALYGEFKVFVRPESMFFESVKDEEGKCVPRFAKVTGGVLEVLEVATEDKVAETVVVKNTDEVVSEVKNEPVEDVVEEEVIEGVNPVLIKFLDSETIDETFDPSIAIQRAVDLYRTKGYDEAWIAKRIKALQERKQLTDVWKENGITDSLEYAILTNEIYRSWSGMTAKEYKQFKGLRKENLRDNMDNIELILTDLSEEATKRLAAKQKPQGLEENIVVAQRGGNVAKVARDNLEEQLGESVVTKDNRLDYKYKQLK